MAKVQIELKNVVMNVGINLIISSEVIMETEKSEFKTHK
jgi:hypothetical protein